MRRLGISIYPEKSTKEEIKNYIDQMSKLGFSRIFSCLLSVEKSKEEIIEDFKDINLYAKEKGFEIIVDVSPRVFQKLGISYQELSFLRKLELMVYV
ncbi:MupG family TIM beta-alpha barrel fold protein [Allocoprobacillus halotolerans]|uniref:MupG family TIM beta-alpha barrel fold protein n=1 Tax=Allocoprobacillus halotolerans TaxID=2944914 RepID=A0ABY5I446_9FIRM|nr:MupG family TIM beta-alpha barrel fold protein [Allocoprobacillus halotolerans]UTY39745.1 MupG family TIM beta-alpha barrel fold protein [Allocoprobacillus halotolerans]